MASMGVLCTVRERERVKDEWEMGLFWMKVGRARQSMIYLYSKALKLSFARRLDVLHQ